MEFGTYRFYCTLHQDAVLPPYKGSTFRGGFGLALKRTVCALKRQDCPSCLLRDSCLYARVFEVKPPEHQYKRLAAAPHPYLIKPPLEKDRHYPAGSSFDFELVLFGQFNQSLPYFIYAMKQLGEKGIGKGQARFSVDNVTSDEQVIFNKEQAQLSIPQQLPMLTLKPSPAQPATVTLHLLTPLRLKHQGQLARTLDFQTLMRAVLRRVSALMSHYGEGEPSLDYRQLIADAAQVTTIDNRLNWHDWQRYSNRQQEAMQFGGLTGNITFDPVPGEYLPLLEFVSQVSLGKQTSFGLGQFVLEIR